MSPTEVRRGGCPALPGDETGARLLAVLGVVLSLGLAACQRAPGTAAPGGTGSVDDGTHLTMWTRSATSQFTQQLVAAYNAGHRNKVALTIIPFDAYQQKVGAAAGARKLPDLLSSDVVYAPNYVTKNLFLDITARVRALPFAPALAPAHLKAVTADGRIYAVPHDLDLSAVFYNKVLFRQAGLDPDRPPTTLTGWVTAARAISRLGGGVSG